ncbi:hypothetical protein HDA32_003296 [Spinactinospora alkalitolerans]|uniref:Putative sensor domain-containing protein n=2 Tax=Spinactinospora alkalitolerans TaxID=687207 RepID=A0A852TUQ3_9ACTN|nr:hypothetical protein [Spinactinospora alkalitolerans]
MLDPLACGQSWLDLLHGVVSFPISVTSFAAVVSWWAVALLGLTYPLYGWIVTGAGGTDGLPELLGLGDGLGIATAFHLAIAVGFTITPPFVVRTVALINAGLGQALPAPVGARGAAPGPNSTGFVPHPIPWTPRGREIS